MAMPSRYSTFDAAVKALLAIHARNEWFVNVYWPDNADRVRRMVEDALVSAGSNGEVHVLDIGCAGGYVSFLLAGLGARVTATDSKLSAGDIKLFEEMQIGHLVTNLNDVQPLGRVSTGTYHVVLLGEVLEHILNHPAALIQEAARVLRAEGRLVLTTPNPSTVMNAWRLLRGRSIAWGATEFIDMPKLVDGKLTPFDGIHYHEYTTQELRRLLEDCGFIIERHEFLSMGASAGQPWLKRFLKTNPLFRRLFGFQAFGCTHYVVARKIK